MKKGQIRATPAQPVPLPHDLSGLPIIPAEPWFQVDPSPNIVLEGPAFDREGNLYVTSPTHGLVYKITQGKRADIVFNDKKVLVDGSAFHRDGRLFVVCLTGQLLILNTESNEPTFLYPEYDDRQFSMNDLVFDAAGYLFVSDFTGTVMDPTGGVYRLSPDLKNVQPVLRSLAAPNGVSLSPDGKTLWIAESTRNAVTRVDLLEDGVTPRPVVGVTCAYYSTGCPGPDSNKVDIKGNLYQCIMGQGRIVILNDRGIPVANVLVEGRDEGKYLRTSNLAFKPDTAEGYITTSGEGGAWIFRFEGLAKGLLLYSHSA
jgi:lactonase